MCLRGTPSWCGRDNLYSAECLSRPCRTGALRSATGWYPVYSASYAAYTWRRQRCTFHSAAGSVPISAFFWLQGQHFLYHGYQIPEWDAWEAVLYAVPWNLWSGYPALFPGQSDVGTSYFFHFPHRSHKIYIIMSSRNC